MSDKTKKKEVNLCPWKQRRHIPSVACTPKGADWVRPCSGGVQGGGETV